MPTKHGKVIKYPIGVFQSSGHLRKMHGNQGEKLHVCSSIHSYSSASERTWLELVGKMLRPSYRKCSNWYCRRPKHQPWYRLLMSSTNMCITIWWSVRFSYSNRRTWVSKSHSIALLFRITKKTEFEKTFVLISASSIFQNFPTVTSLTAGFQLTHFDKIIKIAHQFHHIFHLNDIHWVENDVE